ncbi:MAG: polyamine aminopropyltransferase [Candidatus Saccharibacteria bacterium]|nr:polyamine aminopropyltransferase [Candidatus Saccharibacteria bacterium]
MRRRDQVALFAAAMLVAVGGIIYELILGAAASYLVGDSILSFSLATGVTLFGMGLGSLLVNYIKPHPATSFAINEVVLGLIGGNSVLLLYLGFVFTRSHWLIFVTISLAIGICIGLEIPLLVKMFQKFGRKSSVNLLSKILALDYFGALVASLLFPLVMLPYLGLMRSAYLVAALNIAVAVLILRQMKAPRVMVVMSVIAAMVVAGLFLGATAIERAIDKRTYRDPVLWQQQTPYQKIVLTRYKQDTRLFLNHNLQFSSLDEARYHETLAVSALSSVPNPKRVLIMGGGDGLLTRDVLRYPSIERVTLVDIDEAMTNLAKTNRLLTDVNQRSLSDPRVTIVNQDAFQFAFATPEKYDAVLVDLVDPSNERLAKLYSWQFYRQIGTILTKDGVMVTQATSSFFSPNAFYMVANTVKSAQPGRHTAAFSVNVPSFGEWGFVLSAPRAEAVLGQPLPEGLRYQTPQLVAFLTKQHTISVPAGPVSTLLSPRIAEVYATDMRQWRYE